MAQHEVTFGTGIRFYKHLAKELWELRQEESLCDITLRVSDVCIPAHRCVLAASSPYFRSMLTGGFSEVYAREVDLSQVTNSAGAMERVVRFLYTGRIVIDRKNVCSLVHLSHFFMIEGLETFCKEFISASQNLDNCLEYYCLIVGRCYTELELLVKSRFHDYLLFQDETLNISPAHMRILISEDILKFCRASDVANFLVKWMAKGLTNEYVVTALEVLDCLCSSPNQCRYLLPIDPLEIQNCYEILKQCAADLNLNDSEEIVRKFSLVLPSQPCNVDTTAMTAVTYGKQKHSWNATQDVIITFSPRASLIEHAERIMTKEVDPTIVRLGAVDETGPSVDICCYSPVSNSWYYLGGCSVNQTVRCLFEHQLAQFHCAQNKLLILLPGDGYIHSLDLETMSWTDIQIELIYDGNLNCESEESYFFTMPTVRNGVQYLVEQVNASGHMVDFDFLGHLSCFEVQTDREDIFSCRLLFERYIFPGVKNSVFQSEFVECSKELVIWNNDCPDKELFVVFVADMSITPPKVKTHIYPLSTSDFEHNPRDIRLIRKADRLYFVEGFPRIRPIFEYKYESRILTPLMDTPCIEYDDIMHHCMKTENYPFKTRYCFDDTERMWCIDGREDGASSLTEVTLTDQKTLVASSHTPPPFYYIMAACTGKLESRILENVQPIQKYPLG